MAIPRGLSFLRKVERRFSQLRLKSNSRLSPEAALKHLQRMDSSARIEKPLYSENHQAFRVFFQGRQSVAKFAGTTGHASRDLRREYALIEKLRDTDIPIPRISYQKLGIWGHPFFVMDYVNVLPVGEWPIALHEKSWIQEIQFIEQVPEILAHANGSAMDLEESMSLDLDNLKLLRENLEKCAIMERSYEAILAQLEAAIKETPRLPGFNQAPEMLCDGTRFYYVDWDVAFKMVTPFQWINNLTFYSYFKLDAALVHRHVRSLLKYFDLNPDEPGVQDRLKLWQQYKALFDGAYLAAKANKHAFFNEMKSFFFSGKGVPD